MTCPTKTRLAGPAEAEARRVELGISYVELEKLTGIPKSSLQRHLSGKSRAIRFSDWERICDVLGISPASCSEHNITIKLPKPLGPRDKAKLNGVVRISEAAELALMELCGKTGLSMRHVASALIEQAAAICVIEEADDDE